MLADSSHPLVATVQQFVEGEVLPVASELEHAARYPPLLVDRMRDLGLLGALVPAAWGGLGLDVSTYARITADFPVERYYRDAPRLLLTLGGLEAVRGDLARRLAGG